MATLSYLTQADLTSYLAGTLPGAPAQNSGISSAVQAAVVSQLAADGIFSPPGSKVWVLDQTPPAVSYPFDSPPVQLLEVRSTGSDVVNVDGTGLAAIVTNDAGGNESLLVANSGPAVFVGLGIGDDTLNLIGNGDFIALGGSGSDLIGIAGSGNSTITGGTGTDLIIGGSGNNVLNAGTGASTTVEIRE